ncbi:hypothetical protein [Entomoplasma ellychniae]|nr:hypothetical protein [Entomoplasma ellychniae]
MIITKEIFINKALKISKLQETNVFFPYDKNGKLIKLEYIRINNPMIYKVLIHNMKDLKSKKFTKTTMIWVR